MILLPHDNYRRAAELLQPTDLMNNILGIERELKAPGPNWIGCEASLGELGLVSMAVLRTKGFKAFGKTKVFRSHFKGVPEQPRWIKDYVSATRGYLVLLGWLRYFVERGADSLWYTQNKVEPILLVVARTPPKALLSTLQDFEELLDMYELPVKQRVYTQFDELPSANKLTP